MAALLVPYMDIIQTLAKSPDYFLSEGTHPSESRLSDTHTSRVREVG